MGAVGTLLYIYTIQDFRLAAKQAVGSLKFKMSEEISENSKNVIVILIKYAR